MKTLHYLKDLAEVHTAVVFRDQPPQEHAEGNAHALAIRNIVAAAPVNWSALPRVVVPERYLVHCLHEGDVVIPSRGDYYKAWLFTGPNAQVLPVGQLNVIRPTRLLDAGYLAWYLNLPATNTRISQLLTGTSIKALTKGALLSLEVSLPDLVTQRRVAEIDQLAGRIAAIRHRLTELDTTEVSQMAVLFSQHGGDHA